MLRSVAHRICVMAVLAWMTDSPAQDASRRFEDFSRDPQWESYRSRLLPSPLPVTRQDFGWRNASQPGGKPGEIGGWIQRSLTPAWFAKIIPTRTLNDKLSASGKFAVTQDESTSGVLFGWFHDTSRGWRTPNSLVFRLDGNGGKYWVFYEYGTRHWLTGGGGCFEGERYQTTPAVLRPRPRPGLTTPQPSDLPVGQRRALADDLRILLLALTVRTVAGRTVRAVELTALGDLSIDGRLFLRFGRGGGFGLLGRGEAVVAD